MMAPNDYLPVTLDSAPCLAFDVLANAEFTLEGETFQSCTQAIGPLQGRINIPGNS